jgi:hypothetical protein
VFDSSTLQVPDGIDPITAFRAWHVDSDLRLHSLNHQATWVPGEWISARCSRQRHSAPREGCTCGLYAATDLDEVFAVAPIRMLLTSGEHRSSGAVIGRVQLAGKIIEHDRGYRAEHAWIAEILPISGRGREARVVAERYGVPLGAEIPAEALPEFSDLIPFVGCVYPGAAVSTPPPEPTILGRLYVLTISLFCVINGMRGILWEDQHLDWSDWWLCLIVLGGMLGIRRVIKTLPRAMRGVSFTMPGPRVASPNGSPTIVPDLPRPY